MPLSTKQARTRAERSRSAADEERESTPLPLDESRGGESFESFVRAALENLLQGQRELKTKVETFEASVNKSLEHIFERVETLETQNETLEAKTNKHEEVIEQLAEKCNTLERFSRRNNFRIVGVAVQKGENCVNLVSEMLKNDLHMEAATIERAHRDGRGYQGKPPHILVKMLSYRDKVSVMIKARSTLRDKDFYVVDDLTKVDLKEKKKWKAEVAAAYERGEKCRFVAGKWRGENGVPVKFNSNS